MALFLACPQFFAHTIENRILSFHEAIEIEWI
jgi:hypothetical protein